MTVDDLILITKNALSKAAGWHESRRRTYNDWSSWFIWLGSLLISPFWQSKVKKWLSCMENTHFHVLNRGLYQFRTHAKFYDFPCIFYYFLRRRQVACSQVILLRFSSFHIFASFSCKDHFCGLVILSGEIYFCHFHQPREIWPFHNFTMSMNKVVPELHHWIGF